MWNSLCFRIVGLSCIAWVFGQYFNVCRSRDSVCVCVCVHVLMYKIKWHGYFLLGWMKCYIILWYVVSALCVWHHRLTHHSKVQQVDLHSLKSHVLQLDDFSTLSLKRLLGHVLLFFVVDSILTDVQSTKSWWSGEKILFDSPKIRVQINRSLCCHKRMPVSVQIYQLVCVHQSEPLARNVPPLQSLLIDF